MNIKTVLLATLLSAFPIAVQAQDLENYQLGCDTGAECNDFEVNYEQSDEDKVTQIPRRTRTRRTRTTDSKYYAGGNLGAFFPFSDDDEPDADVGFGLGGLFGYKFTENISAEIEAFDYFGGSEIDDLGYNILGFAANGVFRYPFNSTNSQSPYGFAGGGIGLGIVSATGDVADAADDAGLDTSETGFLFQGKVGVGYPINDSLDLLGQFRYLNVSTDDDENVDSDGASSDGFSLDVGAVYNF